MRNSKNGLALCGQREKQQRRGRYDVSKLLKCDVKAGSDSQQSLRESYIDCVVGRARTGWPEDGTVEDKWQKIRSALITTSDELLGLASSRQPDWFKESESELTPYLIAKNDAYNTWLSRENLTRFRQARYRARKAIRNAKNEWFKAKAMQIEEKRFGGKEVWKNIRDLQHMVEEVVCQLE